MGERADHPVWEVDRALLDALPQPAVAVDPSGAVLHANPAACDVVECRGRDLTGTLLADVLFDDSGRGAFADVLSVVRDGASWSGVLPTRPLGAGGLPADVTLRTVVEGGRAVGVLALVSSRAPGSSAAVDADVAERLTRLARVAADLVMADSVDAVTKIVVQHMADAAGATIATLSLLVAPDTLALVGIRGGGEGVAARWASYSVHEHTPAGEAYRTGRPVVLAGGADIRSRYPDLEFTSDGDRSVAVLPLRIGDRCLGVASMSYAGGDGVSPTELEFLTVMADTCAQALERVRVSAEAADRADKIAFLAEASVELSSSLDYEVTLRKVAELAVPWFADWCAIALDQDGELRTLAVAHVDPEKVAKGLELQQRFPADPQGSSGSYHVLRTGRSELVPEITDEMIDAVITDPEHAQLLRELELRSAMTVPLKVQDRVLGVVTWVAGEAGRRFGVDDLAFGEDLAHRAALAIDTAQLHSQLHEVAARLQRAVLPAELPVLPGWETAASYMQAGRSDAGGDFYDVTPLGDGRLAVFVGDVMGRGVTAAAAMAQMRAAIRALVAVDPEPSAVLPALDRLFEHYDFNQLVTLVYAVADPERGELVVANAGHPPPVLRRADGSVEVIAGEPGLLLGAGGGDRSPITVTFAPGDLLLGYTDGLVERRDEDIETGVERLVVASGEADDADLFTWLADVVLAVRDTRRDDDVAVLALRRDPERAAGSGAGDARDNLG
ncbi:MAG TPA: SpoIIE family protein phosphatase [Nocardioidaceae bacterium]|nr:SpoIIE family protein phosphatase [Nocardioidaceae bacterium]